MVCGWDWAIDWVGDKWGSVWEGIMVGWGGGVIISHLTPPTYA